MTVENVQKTLGDPNGGQTGPDPADEGNVQRFEAKYGSVVKVEKAIEQNLEGFAGDYVTSAMLNALKEVEAETVDQLNEIARAETNRQLSGEGTDAVMTEEQRHDEALGRAAEGQLLGDSK